MNKRQRGYMLLAAAAISFMPVRVEAYAHPVTSGSNISGAQETRSSEIALKVKSSNDEYGTASIKNIPITSKNDDTGVSMSYFDGNLTVTSLSEAAPVVIEAQDGDEAAGDVKISSVTVDKQNSASISVFPGSRVMLWSSLEDMIPLVPAIGIPEISDDGKILAAPSDTVCTVSARPAEGCVFTGWTNAEDAVVSKEAEYTFILCENTELTARFKKQGASNDVYSFSLVSDKGEVKAAPGKLCEISVADPTDADGYEVNVSNADANWSCSEPGITVSDGIVYLDDGFSIDDDSVKDVKVTAELSNIVKTYTLTVYSYDFYETVKDGRASSEWDGAIAETAGRWSLAFPEGGMASTLVLPEKVSLDDTKTLSFKVAGGGSDSKFCGEPRYFEFYDSNGIKVIEDVIGFSWTDLYVGGDIGAYTIKDPNGILKGVASMDEWSSDITITVDKAAGSAVVRYGETSASAAVDTAAADISEIRIVSVKSAPDHTRRCLAVTDLIIK